MTVSDGCFTLPESLWAYMNNKDISTAVDHLVDHQNKAPAADLNWDEVTQHHKATLSALIVKYDFISCLQELLDKLWDPVLKSFTAEFQKCSRPEILEDHPYFEAKADTLWDSGEWVGIAKQLRSGSLLWYGILLDAQTRQLRASFSFTDKNWEQIDLNHSKHLFSDWEYDESEEYWYTKLGLLNISGKNFDITGLRDTAILPMLNYLKDFRN